MFRSETSGLSRVSPYDSGLGRFEVAQKGAMQQL